VDTRSKIVTAPVVVSNAAPDIPRNAAVVVGHFDVLGLEHARALAAVRARSSHVVAIVLPTAEGAAEILSQPDRARMAAALRVIDYVLIAGPNGRPAGLDDLLTSLTPSEVVCLDDIEADILSRRLRRLKEHP
jgi:glycerol-3-phosphate cytidylyltransferase-like family protein